MNCISIILTFINIMKTDQFHEKEKADDKNISKSFGTGCLHQYIEIDSNIKEQITATQIHRYLHLLKLDFYNTLDNRISHFYRRRFKAKNEIHWCYGKSLKLIEPPGYRNGLISFPGN